MCSIDKESGISNEQLDASYIRMRNIEYQKRKGNRADGTFTLVARLRLASSRDYLPKKRERIRDHTEFNGHFFGISHRRLLLNQIVTW